VNYLGNEVMRERIADCRKEQGLSYAKLGKLTGLPISTLRRIEVVPGRNVKENFIIRLSDFYSVDPMWLMGYDCPKAKESPKHKTMREEVNDRLMLLSEDQMKDLALYIDTMLLRRK
jgi:transcriptional regulator with XRE-family HTH domain